MTIVKKRREELKEALGINAWGSCAKASYDSQKKVVENDRRRGALRNKRLGGFLREGLSDGRLAARDARNEAIRASFTIVELNRMRQRETHYETVVIAMACFQGLQGYRIS